MHETRNFILVVSLIACVIWAIIVWFVLDPERATLLTAQRLIGPALIVGIGAWLFYALMIEDRLPDYMREAVGSVYYEADGLSFLPTVRVNRSQAELCLYYQNRYENPVEAIIHLRMPEDSFIVRTDMRDVNFAFRCGGGDYGVIHQPIAVPRHLQGEVVTVQMAAATYYPRSHGACWRKNPGIPCGTLPADWSGSAFKSGVHECSSEMELTNPIEFHLAMPTDVETQPDPDSARLWKQEQLMPGVIAA